MREIKFRAWVKEWKKYYNVLSVSFDSKKIVINAGHNFHHILDFNEVILEQYTGLKDKDGVEIYAGDIVKVYENQRFFEFVGKVEFRSGSFVIGNYYTHDIPNGYCEVIGNIHENGDLLK